MGNVAISLGIINWCLNFIAIVIFLSIIITGVKHRRELRNISLVLTYNTCLAALLTCLTVCFMISSSLSTGFLTYNLNFCYAWGLLYDIFECSLYHSYYLQAFYRLCRVVFYKKKYLLSYSLYISLICGQWLLTITILLPPVFINWYVRLSTEQYCLVPYTYLGPELYHIIILYLIPLVCITITYIWITMFIRKSSQTSSIILAAKQQQRNLRDLTVIKRIVLLISVLIVLRFPTIIFMIYAVIVGHLYPLTFSIVGLITSACLIFVGLMMIQITPQLRNTLFTFLSYRHNRVDVQQIMQLRLAGRITTGAHTTPPKANKPTNTRKEIVSAAKRPPFNDPSHVILHSVKRRSLSSSI